MRPKQTRYARQLAARACLPCSLRERASTTRYARPLAARARVLPRFARKKWLRSLASRAWRTIGISLGTRDGSLRELESLPCLFGLDLVRNQRICNALGHFWSRNVIFLDSIWSETQGFVMFWVIFGLENGPFWTRFGQKRKDL